MVILRKIAFAALILALAPLSVQAGPNALGQSSSQKATRTSGKLPFDRLVVFGDSLSDPGNAFFKSRAFVVRPYDPVPDAPYAIGRFHFSNGPTWIEWLARDVRLFDSARPALLRPGVYSNYAIGAAPPDPGATAREVDPSFPSLKTEIADFLADFGGSAPPEALYVIWIGANDLFDALNSLQTDPTGAAAQEIIQDAPSPDHS